MDFTLWNLHSCILFYRRILAACLFVKLVLQLSSSVLQVLDRGIVREPLNAEQVLEMVLPACFEVLFFGGVLRDVSDVNQRQPPWLVGCIC